MKKRTDSRITLLNELSMPYETAVIPLYDADYTKEFCTFYHIYGQTAKTVPFELRFSDALKEICGDNCQKAIAETAVRLFGVPKRITVLEDGDNLIKLLEGPDGYAPFFFVFDLMFCEYDHLTLCFLSGSNN